MSFIDPSRFQALLEKRRELAPALLALWIASLLLGAALPFRVASASSHSQSVPPAGTVVLCLPGIYPNNPGDCTPAGPSQYLTQMAQKGIVLPLPPLPAAPINPALAEIDLRYAEVTTQGAPVYGSIGDAVAGNKKLAVRTLNGEFIYISYTEQQEVSGKKIYTIGFGNWMRGADLSRIGVLPRQQGVVLNRTPNSAFGWVLTYFAPGPVESRYSPGGANTGRVLNLYEIVPVFAEERVDEEVWYMIGPDEWVQQKYIARVTPNTVPPAGASGERWIEVNLFEQTLAVYDRRQLVFATIIASGSDPFWTRPGLFQIYNKLEKTDMSGATEADRSDAYFLQNVPWAMYYDDARALHGAYWRAKMGFPQSHGCVNLTVGDAHWLFNWAREGDWVYVWDPSGITPTDPSLFGPGGY